MPGVARAELEGQPAAAPALRPRGVPLVGAAARAVADEGLQVPLLPGGGHARGLQAGAVLSTTALHCTVQYCIAAVDGRPVQF